MYICGIGQTAPACHCRLSRHSCLPTENLWIVTKKKLRRPHAQRFHATCRLALDWDANTWADDVISGLDDKYRWVACCSKNDPDRDYIVEGIGNHKVEVCQFFSFLFFSFFSLSFFLCVWERGHDIVVIN